METNYKTSLALDTHVILYLKKTELLFHTTMDLRKVGMEMFSDQLKLSVEDFRPVQQTKFKAHKNIILVQSWI